MSVPAPLGGISTAGGLPHHGGSLQSTYAAYQQVESPLLPLSIHE